MREGLKIFLEGVLEGTPLDTDEKLAQMLERTPRRVTSAFSEDLLVGYRSDPEKILTPVPLPGARGPVALGGLRFTSVCAHHLLPYEGQVLLAFVPDGVHAGLGRLARLVDCLSRRLTLQETLTAAIADELQRALSPRALVVRIEATHSCLSARGARKEGHRFQTIERRGERHADLESLL